MKITVTDPILRFSETTQKPCVSIYYPTHRGGPETRQDPIRLKNLLRKAHDSLDEIGYESEAAAILDPVKKLIPDLEFWRHQQEGLALFASPGSFRYFHLPYTVPEISLVSTDFYLKPILPLFSRNEQFYILALSKNSVKLYESNRYSIHHVDVPELPDGMAEAMQFDEGEQQLQQHSFGPTTGPSGGSMRDQGIAMFHGQGGEKDIHHDDLLRYFNVIDRGLRRHLNGSQLPLVLAGVDYYFPIYRKANKYPHLLEEGISGGIEAMPETELREKAWPVVRPYLDPEEKKAIKRFERIAYHNGDAAKNATRDLESAVIAAFEGRVDALILPRDEEVWGEFDEETEEVKRESNNPSKRRELTDFAAMQTIRHGGEVFLLPRENMPPQAEVAGLLRYSGGQFKRAG